MSGPTSIKSNYQVTYEDGSKITYRSNGTSRQASASGTVSYGDLNFAPFASVSADINSSKNGSLSLTKY